MPVVPTEFVQDVLPQGRLVYQDIHATPHQFGGQLAHTLDLAGRRLQRDAIFPRQLIDATNVNDVYANQFDPAFRDMYTNFLKLDGKAAAEQLPAFQQRMTDLAAQTRDALPNDEQRQTFDLICRRRLMSDFDGMARHAADETARWQTDTTGAMSDAFARGIVDNRLDYDKVAGPQGLIQSIRNLNEAHSALMEEDKSVSNLRASAAIDKGLSDAVLTEAQINPTGAKMLYDRYSPYMSSDDVRNHVLDNLVPQISEACKIAAYRDAYGKFNLADPDSDIDAAAKAVMNPVNYQGLGPEERSDIARSLQAEWNRARRQRDLLQSAADNNFQTAVIDRSINGEQLLSWKDPKIGLPPSDDLFQEGRQWLADPRTTERSDPAALSALTDSITDRRPLDVGAGHARDAVEINRAFMRGELSQADWQKLRDLQETSSDPAKSRWFDYAKEAFDARFGDLSSPAAEAGESGTGRAGIDFGAGASPPAPDAPALNARFAGGAEGGANPGSGGSPLFPRLMTDLDGAIRDGDLKAVQVRDLTNKMLDDVATLYLAGRDKSLNSSIPELQNSSDTNTG